MGAVVGLDVASAADAADAAGAVLLCGRAAAVCLQSAFLCRNYPLPSTDSPHRCSHHSHHQHPVLLRTTQDFDSLGLKNKKHWQSFTSPFFLDASWVLAQLRGGTGRLQYSLADKEALLKGDLHCHRCGAFQANMPKLKAHIASCAAPLPGAPVVAEVAAERGH